LCAYVHNSKFDPEKFTLDNINELVDPRKVAGYQEIWQEAFDLWSQHHPGARLPFFAPERRESGVPQEEQVKFRVTGQRRGVKGQVTSMTAAARLGDILYESYPSFEASMKQYDMEVFIDMNIDQFMVGVPLTLERVSIRNRVVCGPTTLDAANAYALLKWANIQPGDVVLDPMGGAGTIPIEGSHLYPASHFINSDLTWFNMDISNQNIKACAGKGPLSLFCADASRLPIRPQSVDVVISDLPFGQRHGSVSANKSLYPALFKQMERVLRTGGRAVLLTMAKSVIKGIIKERERIGWTLVQERPLEVGGYLSWVFVLSYEFRPMASNANRELVHKMTGKPRSLCRKPKGNIQSSVGSESTTGIEQVSSSN
jgi:23S rRNA G2445 N2-methylase RlmL